MFEAATKGAPRAKHHSSVCVPLWEGGTAFCVRVCAEYKDRVCALCVLLVNSHFKENLIPSFVPQLRAQFGGKQ